MWTFQVIGMLFNALGYRVIIDQYTTTGAIYFGLAKSGTLKSENGWYIIKLLQTESNKINDFEWANKEGMKHKIWNNRADGTYTYQTD